MTNFLVKAEYFLRSEQMPSLGLFFPRSPNSVLGPLPPQKSQSSRSLFLFLPLYLEKCVNERVPSNISKAMRGIHSSFCS